MKKKGFLLLVTAASLLGCQQQDEFQNIEQESVSISAIIESQSLKDLLTRNNIAQAIPVKQTFSTGEVISMATSEQNFASHALGIDSWNWSEANKTSTTILAHYPAIETEEIEEAPEEGFRTIKGGEEYLFGTSQATIGDKQVELSFNRMTVPVILLDDEGNPYDGDATVKFFVKNTGIQNLATGEISVDQTAKVETVEIKQISDGELTHLLPQTTIKEGEVLGEVSLDGKTETIIATEDIEFKAGSALVMRMHYFNPRRVIFERLTPLRK